MLRATAKSKRIVGLLVVLALGTSIALHPPWLFGFATRFVGFGFMDGVCPYYDPCRIVEGLNRYVDGVFNFDPTLILFLLAFYIFAERLLLKGWGRGTPYSNHSNSGGSPD